MVKKLLLFTILIGLLSSCNDNTNTPITSSLHDNWSFIGDSDTIWRSASVPGNIFTDLLDHKLIEDPFILNNEEKVQWVSDEFWIYQSDFSIDSKQLSKKHQQLVFEGLDTYANVYLNDTLILEAKNAFRTYEVDVAKHLLSKNQLRVEFTPTKEIEEFEKEKLDYGTIG